MHWFLPEPLQFSSIPSCWGRHLSLGWHGEGRLCHDFVFLLGRLASIALWTPRELGLFAQVPAGRLLPFCTLSGGPSVVFTVVRCLKSLSRVLCQEAESTQSQALGAA